MTHLRTSPFPPKPSDIVGNFYNKPKPSIYDIQALEQKQEQLALLEYHESNEVIPMPDHIHELLERLAKKRLIGGDDNVE
ncbi:hypothetical protein [Paenibacillus pseudetheri]|uniref:Uncharacterized protein n=1 Tax=Paenibacillus pseudetheri TaxID=2897682 RepID=A0ABN8F7N9_9BACL|nr:hypothetical protein [Paenibacillus pseudetheri]CAH1054066.1 hypothetical protein PAECIP111894_00211 [Paenibacillus pseudetheri]